jgi:hypothetical protein
MDANARVTAALDGPPAAMCQPTDNVTRRATILDVQRTGGNGPRFHADKRAGDGAPDRPLRPGVRRGMMLQRAGDRIRRRGPDLYRPTPDL